MYVSHAVALHSFQKLEVIIFLTTDFFAAFWSIVNILFSKVPKSFPDVTMWGYVSNGDDTLLYMDKNFPNNKWLGVKHDSESLA